MKLNIKNYMKSGKSFVSKMAGSKHGLRYLIKMRINIHTNLYNLKNEIQWDEDFDARRGGKWAVRPEFDYSEDVE